MTPVKNLASALRTAAETVEQLNLREVDDQRALRLLARMVFGSFEDVIVDTEQSGERPVLH